MGSPELKNWKDWIEYKVYVESKKQILSSAFKEAELFLACASNYYQLEKLPIPQISIVSGNKAGIDYCQKLIVIGEALLYGLFENDTDFEKNSNHFLLIVAHEFFHYGRCHNKVKEELHKNFDDQSSKANLQKYFQVLEDDADRLATASLFRHFQFHKYKDKDSYHLKISVLDALFKPIRLKIIGTIETNQFNTSHPVWSARLFSQVIKLSELDTRNIKISTIRGFRNY